MPGLADRTYAKFYNGQAASYQMRDDGGKKQKPPWTGQGGFETIRSVRL